MSNKRLSFINTSFQTFTMRLSTSSLVALLAPAVTARFIERTEGNNVQLYPQGVYEESSEKFLVELAPGDTKWITEEEKWELRRVSPRTSSSPQPSARPSLHADDHAIHRMANSSWTSPRPKTSAHPGSTLSPT